MKQRVMQLGVVAFGFLAGLVGPLPARANAWTHLEGALATPIPPDNFPEVSKVLFAGAALKAPVPAAELAAVRKLALDGLLPVAKAWNKAAQEKSCEVTGTQLDERLTVLKQGRALLEAAVAGVDAREQVLVVHRVGLLMGQCKGAGMVGLVVGQSLQQNAINVAHWLWSQGGLDGPGRAAVVGVALLGPPDLARALEEERVRANAEVAAISTLPTGFDRAATVELLDALHKAAVTAVKNKVTPTLDTLRAAVKTKDPRADPELMRLMQRAKAKETLTPEEEKTLAQPNLTGRLYAFSVVGGMLSNLGGSLNGLEDLKAKHAALASNNLPRK